MNFMATFEDLEKEVRTLRAKVNRLGGNPAAANAAAVSAIVEPGDDERLITNGGSASGFAAACAKSTAQASRRSEAQAIREARAGSARSQEALRSFYDRHVKLLGRRRCDEILNEYEPR